MAWPWLVVLWLCSGLSTLNMMGSDFLILGRLVFTLGSILRCSLHSQVSLVTLVHGVLSTSHFPGGGWSFKSTLFLSENMTVFLCHRCNTESLHSPVSQVPWADCRFMLRRPGVELPISFCCTFHHCLVHVILFVRYRRSETWWELCSTSRGVFVITRKRKLSYLWCCPVRFLHCFLLHHILHGLFHDTQTVLSIGIFWSDLNDTDEIFWKIVLCWTMELTCLDTKTSNCLPTKALVFPPLTI